MSTIPIRGLVLAGGHSRRFGGVDKTFMKLGSMPLWQHALARLAPQVDAIAISSNDQTGRLTASMQAYAGTVRYRTEGAGPAHISIFPDRIAGSLGPLAGIHAGLGAWPEYHVVTVAVDLPFIPPNLVAHLSAGADHRERCAYASDGKRHALAMLWPPGSAPALAEFLERGGRSVHDWLVEHGDPVWFTAPGDTDLFFNINTPADLAVAERRLREREHG
ncbi:MAG: molybdenum cofactor guanylyltransferase [Acidiferrobacterales bacterium]